MKSTSRYCDAPLVHKSKSAGRGGPEYCVQRRPRTPEGAVASIPMATSVVLRELSLSPNASTYWGSREVVRAWGARSRVSRRPRYRGGAAAVDLDSECGDLDSAKLPCLSTWLIATLVQRPHKRPHLRISDESLKDHDDAQRVGVLMPSVSAMCSPSGRIPSSIECMDKDPPVSQNLMKSTILACAYFTSEFVDNQSKYGFAPK
jgi:hypothetical protein